jgi:hypothetical protein
MNRQLTVQESRRKLARDICHGKRGQLGALGLVVNAAVLWTTRYLDAAVEQLRALPAEAREHDVLNEDVTGSPRSSTRTSTCWAATASASPPRLAAASPYAARHRFGRSLSVHSGQQKAKARRRLPVPCHSQHIAHRGPCGKTRVVPQNLRPKPERAEIRDREVRVLLSTYGSRRTSNRRWDSRCGCGHSVRRCGCACRRTARSSWPKCNLVEWGVS